MILLQTAFLILALTAGVSLLTGRHSRLASWTGVVGASSAGLLTVVAALQGLSRGSLQSWSTGWGVPAGSLALQLDPLSACFLLPIAVLGICCAIYGAGYLSHEGARRSLATHWCLYLLMFAAMLLVVSAANVLLFLIAWEIMTMSSFLLVAWDHHQEAVRKAAWLYLLAAHCGLMLLLAFFLQAGTISQSQNFSDFAPLARVSLPSASLLFLLALFGFGVKAGLLPVHIWLPDAHPAAPSHVSALMSGALVKTGIYGILRVLSLLPPNPAWWGWVIAGLGIAGALYGIAMACLQRDIKRSLAYSTIENVGIILLGLGFGFVAKAQGHQAIALLALAGALLHIWNHALFKGLMFLGAGSLLHATGTRNMNLMGGLLKRMPLTGLLWIGGSLAISALPPFNGLVSEWLIYLGLLQGGIVGSGVSGLSALLLIGLLGIVGTLALVTFMRLVGICLLGEPRSQVAGQAHEAGPLMLIPMAVLLAACLVIGLFPQYVVGLLNAPLSQISGQPVSLVLPEALTSFGRFNGALILVFLAVALFLGRLRNRRITDVQATWGCGFQFPTTRMSYTGEAFSELAFRRVLPRPVQPDIEVSNVSGLFPGPSQVQQTSRDSFLTYQWQPLFIWLADRCQRLRWLQQGQLAIYLLYMFAASTLLLAWTVWTSRGGG